MSISKARLDKVAQIHMGQAPSGDSYNNFEQGWPLVAGAGDFHGTEIRTKKHTTVAPKLSKPGDVLISIRASIGDLAIADKEYCIGRGVAAIRPDESMLDVRYLWNWLSHIRNELAGMGRGATFLQVSKADVSGLMIPLPNLEEQKRIAAILDEADKLRTNCYETNTLLDEMAFSIFDELFSAGRSRGSAVESRTWAKQKIKELGRITTGKTPPGSLNGMYGGEIPFITPGDLESGEPPIRKLTLQGVETVRTVKKGSLLVCCIGTIGKMAVAQEESSFNQQINAVEWFESITPSYGLFAMRQMKPHLIGKSSATTVPILNKSNFQELMIPVPPISVQLEFEERLSVIEDLAVKVKHELDLAEELFLSLQERAFNGEL